jgi:hypothetical protein
MREREREREREKESGEVVGDTSFLGGGKKIHFRF